MRQTGSKYNFRGVQIPILVVSQLASHVFPQIITKFDQTLSRVSTTPEIEIDFRDVQNPIFAVSRLW